MSGRTHAAVAAALGIWTGGLAAPAWTVAVTLGGLLPDLDEPESALGRRCWWLAWPLKRLVGHRTLSHSLVGVLAAGALAWGIGWWAGWRPEIAVGLMVGMLTHILLDALSGSVLLWWPKPIRVSLARWPVFGWQDRLLGGIAGIVAGVGLGLAIQHEISPWLALLRGLR